MNYAHAYHAGNFCDVVKHICLIGLMEAFKKKSTPFCYIDTHAGAGSYDLFSEFSNKTKEYENGIEKVIEHEHPPTLVKDYLRSVHLINSKLTDAKISSLRYYPGSPMIARQLMRPGDSMVLCELHPTEYQSLKQNFIGDHQVAVHHTDGFLGLKAFLPPKERRGLILIDPPYEDPNEFSRIARSLPIALKRFPRGVYAIWYPVKEQAHVDHFYQSVKKYIDNPVFVMELTVYPDIPQHLNGCGMAIINPPWQFDETMQNTLKWVWKALSINGEGKLNMAFCKTPLKFFGKIVDKYNNQDEVIIMKKQFFVTLAIVLTASLLTACTQSQRKNTGMVAGGVLGGVAGSALTGGSTAGTIAGAVGGGYLGRELSN